jgi:hypothetical protein
LTVASEGKGHTFEQSIPNVLKLLLGVIHVKGFPNQVAELPKIATGIRCLVDIEAAGKNGKDDGVFGEALVRAGVAGTNGSISTVGFYFLTRRNLTPLCFKGS